MIHTFLYDQSFLNTASVLDPILKTGGICVLSSQSLSYFVSPLEFPDERPVRANNLNTTMPGRPRLIADNTEYPSFFSDTVNLWTATERENLFAIIDQLCFAFNKNATSDQVELALSAWPQYVPSTYVYSNTHTAALVYNNIVPPAITCPDYVTFSFIIANGTEYQIRVWLNNALFYADYPLSTIRAVIPPLPLTDLYTLSITSSVANVFATAKAAATTNQQMLQGYIQSGQYSGYVAYNVTFVDGSGDSTQVQFNLLYNGCIPGAIAIRTAIREFLLNSGVGTEAGWRAIAPSLFVTELFYLLPMFDQTTNLINSIIYPNITPIQKTLSDAALVLFDIPSGFITSNLDIIATFYDNLTVLAVPDPGNDPLRLSLAAEHPTYQDVATTSLSFATMTSLTQQFSALLGAALSVAVGNASTNNALSPYTPPNDTRNYITFSVGDVEYYVMTKTSYLALVH